jgi:hypothetical protein
LSLSFYKFIASYRYYIFFWPFAVNGISTMSRPTDIGRPTGNPLTDAILGALTNALAADASVSATNAFQSAIINALIKALNLGIMNDLPLLSKATRVSIEAADERKLYFLFGHYDTVCGKEGHFRLGTLLPDPRSQDIINLLTWLPPPSAITKPDTRKPEWNISAGDGDAGEIGGFCAATGIMIRGKENWNKHRTRTLKCKEVVLASISNERKYILATLNAAIEEIQARNDIKKWWQRRNRLWIVTGIQYAAKVDAFNAKVDDNAFELKVAVDPYDFIKVANTSIKSIQDMIAFMESLFPKVKSKKKEYDDALAEANQALETAKKAMEEKKAAEKKAEEAKTPGKTEEKAQAITEAITAAQKAAEAVDAAKAAALIVQDAAGVPRAPSLDGPKPDGTGVGIDYGYSTRTTFTDGYSADNVGICYSLTKLIFKVESSGQVENVEYHEFEVGDIQGRVRRRAPASRQVEQDTAKVDGIDLDDGNSEDENSDVDDSDRVGRRGFVLKNAPPHSGCYYNPFAGLGI